MNLFERIKRRLSPRPVPIAPRTLPEPARVNLSEREVHDEHFVRLPEWSTYTPAPPVWQLPDLDEQRRWVDQLVAAHAERGGLDGLVPDLLDRLIHHEMDEVRQTIEEAHTQATYQAQTMWEQAKLAQVRAAVELRDARSRFADADEGYIVAYTVLTGAPPARRVVALSVEPTCIATQVAPVGLPATAPVDRQLEPDGADAQPDAQPDVRPVVRPLSLADPFLVNGETDSPSRNAR